MAWKSRLGIDIPRIQNHVTRRHVHAAKATKYAFALFVSLIVAGTLVGCDPSTPLAPEAPHEGAVLGESADDARQPAHVTASSGAPFEAGWFWVQGTDNTIMNGRAMPDGATWPTDFLDDAEFEPVNLRLIPATRRGDAQELFLTWQEGAEGGKLYGQFLEHDSSASLGSQLTISTQVNPDPVPPFVYSVNGNSKLRQYATASLSNEDDDRVLAAWIGADGNARGSFGSDPTRYWFLHWRMVGRADDGAAVAGTTRAPMGPVRSMYWITESWPVLPNECNEPAWGTRHNAVDVAAGGDHFLIVWIAREWPSDRPNYRVMASRVEPDGTRAWDVDSDPGTTMRGCDVTRFFDVVVDAQSIFGSVAAAYDSLRDRYLVVFTRKSPDGTNYDIIGRFISPDGSLQDQFDINSPAVDSGASLLDLPALMLGKTLLMVEYNSRWDRYAIAFRTDTPRTNTLMVTELAGHHSAPAGDRPIRSTSVELEGGLEFVYGDLKSYETAWAGMRRGCFAMAFESKDTGAGRDSDSQVRYTWWCDPW